MCVSDHEPSILHRTLFKEETSFGAVHHASLGKRALTQRLQKSREKEAGPRKIGVRGIMEGVEVTGSLRETGRPARGHIGHVGVEGDQVVIDETIHIADTELRLHDAGAGHIKGGAARTLAQGVTSSKENAGAGERKALRSKVS